MKRLPLSDQPTYRQPNPETETLPKRLPKISRKRLIYAAIAFGTIFLVVQAFRPAPIPVDTGLVSRGELRVTVNAEGKTRVRDRFTISAPVDGRLARIELDEGDKIKQGDMVAKIDPLPLTSSVKEALGRLAEWQAQRQGVATQRPKEANLEQARQRIQAAIANQRQAEARVIQAQAALAQARRDNQRAQELQASGVIPRQDREVAELNQTTRAKELETARLAAKASANEVEVAQAALTVLQQQKSDPDYLLKVYDARIASVEAELAKLKDEAARTDIHSPVSGQVLRVQKKSAQYVTSGTPLLDIGNVSNLELVIDVLSGDATKIKPGAQIFIVQGTETEAIQAKVRYVEPSAFTKVSALGVEEQRVNVIGDFTDKSHLFGDAYRVDVQIVVWDRENLLKVPLSSLFRCGKSWCTFVVNNGKANRRQIEVGQRSDFEAEIRQGLKEGEAVILHPSEQIEDGKPVTVR
ncbi:efflux RND transporter periplasmic adaptor subunit [Calothrix sp. UHCC 0171]|uniref:efflux RND transporter periplasmic adaptor subunit n=1 Tax=Calothrix sp. UHCC 0171 TaxID=3110245 RepID=UPI002B1EBE3F|nr:HlyD family efflux transporter periplasmic adaptor subunit [Calothrix sp. UHCC 0171]MEA5574152.1 HlyD family efflux transporter periplasmic adaptor subunit [Calothrix sp. UHCC 0171]